MSVLASSILSRVGATLNDEAHVRWPLGELLDWLNDGQRSLAKLVPDASVRAHVQVLVGGTRQELPDDGIRLVDVPRNMLDETTPGRAVRSADRGALDAYDPDWHQATEAATVRFYTFDERDPKHFFVYPPQPDPGMGSVELVYAAVPADIALDQMLEVDGIYAGALVDYVLYRAISKDSEDSSSDAQRASRHYAAFERAVTGKSQADERAEPYTGG